MSEFHVVLAFAGGLLIGCLIGWDEARQCHAETDVLARLDKVILKLREGHDA